MFMQKPLSYLSPQHITTSPSQVMDDSRKSDGKLGALW